jgi:hypothetical protein
MRFVVKAPAGVTSSLDSFSLNAGQSRDGALELQTFGGEPVQACQTAGRRTPFSSR